MDRFRAKSNEHPTTVQVAIALLSGLGFFREAQIWLSSRWALRFDSVNSGKIGRRID
jgi:hypothetical protein